MKKGVGSGVGSVSGAGSGSISQRYGSGDPDPDLTLPKMPKISNTASYTVKKVSDFPVPSRDVFLVGNNFIISGWDGKIANLFLQCTR
jgi:hypothetical protein